MQTIARKPSHLTSKSPTAPVWVSRRYASMCPGSGATANHTGTRTTTSSMHTRNMPEQKRPDVRPELRELLEWYREVVERIEAGAIVEPGEEDRLREEAALVDELLQRLDQAHESASDDLGGGSG
jgi:hypothetical protein